MSSLFYRYSSAKIREIEILDDQIRLALELPKDLGRIVQLTLVNVHDIADCKRQLNFCINRLKCEPSISVFDVCKSESDQCFTLALLIQSAEVMIQCEQVIEKDIDSRKSFGEKTSFVSSREKRIANYIGRENDQAHENRTSPQFTKLTAAHSCDQCKKTLWIPRTNTPRVTGRIHSTQKCGYCERFTSVYAILHVCCSCDVLLESPRRTAGNNFECPVCQCLGQVPCDVLESTDSAMVERSAVNPSFFEVQCSGCGEPWAAKVGDSGKIATCPDCYLVFQIPCYGEHLKFNTRLFLQTKIRCAKCRHAIPKSLKRCPVCDAETHP